ncbi:MAG: DUF1499 domain-containing protein [Planctomycetes bacterium]|nr:DUF1499 domain-containing protein [Planctomycetota bacterium]
MLWKILAVASALVLAPIAVFAALSLFSRRPKTLGVSDARLAPCPKSPNCVCTRDDDELHKIEPLKYRGGPEESRRQLVQLLEAQPTARIVTREADYIHAEFTSRLFRFVDDAEFLFDDAAGLIHFRSASRAGRSDFGVNRRRMEAIRAAFETSAE